MHSFFTDKVDSTPINIDILNKNNSWREELSPESLNWLDSTQFEESQFALMPDEAGRLAKVYVLVDGERSSIEQICDLVYKLPASNTYCLQGLSQADYEHHALYWGMHAYQFNLYKEAKKSPATLFLPEEVNQARVNAILEGIFLTRDLINTPTEEMNTAHISELIQKICSEQGAKFTEVVGDKLIKENYPAIHTVGRASDHEPRLCTLTWGDPTHKKLTLVGKGITFDTGGLNVKPGGAMGLMKKDMGGAANALGLALMIMKLRLPIYLNVFLPLAENSISANAMRPGDVIRMRSGLTVEVTNTDAEGRLVLADAIVKACEDEPELLIDFATLTGAARVAVGTEMAAFFTRNDILAHQLVDIGQDLDDWVWQLPLYKPYKKLINSKIADLDNSGGSPYAGATTAALFLNEFVDESINWLHFDMMAYNVSSRAGHPEGGEAQGLRTLLHYLESEFV
jgi:leucyl aminopeptidase